MTLTKQELEDIIYAIDYCSEHDDEHDDGEYYLDRIADLRVKLMKELEAPP